MKLKTNKHPKVRIPDFVFSDGSSGEFIGYDRLGAPIGEEKPRWVLEMGLFDDAGNYFVIDIDTRKKSLTKTPTYYIDSEAFCHPITCFSTIGCYVNPENGHSLPHHNCYDCVDFLQRKLLAKEDMIKCDHCENEFVKFQLEWRPTEESNVWGADCLSCRSKIHDKRYEIQEDEVLSEELVTCPQCEKEGERFDIEWEETEYQGVFAGTCPSCDQAIFEARIEIPDPEEVKTKEKKHTKKGAKK